MKVTIHQNTAATWTIFTDTNEGPKLIGIADGVLLNKAKVTGEKICGELQSVWGFDIEYLQDLAPEMVTELGLAPGRWQHFEGNQAKFSYTQSGRKVGFDLVDMITLEKLGEVSKLMTMGPTINYED